MWCKLFVYALMCLLLFDVVVLVRRLYRGTELFNVEDALNLSSTRIPHLGHEGLSREARAPTDASPTVSNLTPARSVAEQIATVLKADDRGGSLVQTLLFGAQSELITTSTPSPPTLNTMPDLPERNVSSPSLSLSSKHVTTRRVSQVIPCDILEAALILNVVGLRSAKRRRSGLLESGEGDRRGGSEHAAITGNSTLMHLIGTYFPEFPLKPQQQQLNEESRENGYLRFIVAEGSVKPGYGFTSQLLVYAGMLAYAVRDSRRIFLPPSARVNLEEMVDLSQSRFFEGARIIPRACLEKPRIEQSLRALQTRKLRRYALRDGPFRAVDRLEVVTAPNLVSSRFSVFMNMSQKMDVIKLYDMYLRYPFEVESGFPDATVANFLCGLKFRSPIEHAASQSIRVIEEKSRQVHGDGSFLSIHLRVEPQDIYTYLLPRALPHSDQIYEFITRGIAPLCRQHGIHVIYICSAKLAADQEEGLSRAAKATGIEIVSKFSFQHTQALREDPVPFDPSKYKAVYGGKPVVITSAMGAALDLLLMERAKVAVVPSFSTYSLAVYSRRCGGVLGEWRGSHCSFNQNVFVYDYDVRGRFSIPVYPYPCGYSVMDYHRGVNVRKPRKEAFSSKYTKDTAVWEHAEEASRKTL